jgi:hypothetical protein
MKHILIVGAGPSAYVSTLTCLELNFKVSVLNPQMEQWTSYKESNLLKKLILKKRNESTLFKTPVDITDIESKKVDVFENFYSGGLSELWGGVFLPPLSGKEFLVEHTIDELDQAINFIQNQIFIDGQDSQVYQAYRTRGLQNKKVNSSPSIAKSRINKNKNWSAREGFSTINSKNVNYIDGFLQSVQQKSDNKVEVCYRNDYGHEYLLEFDKVFLATGVFGTARILFDNISDINEIKVSDSKVSYGLGVFLGLKVESKMKKQMSPYAIQAYGAANGEARRFAQVYEISEELIDSIKYRFLRACVIQVNKILINRLRLVMIFSASDVSDGIVIKRGDNKLIASKNKSKKPKQIIDIDFIKPFIGNQILPFPLKMSFKPGAGVHNGAFRIAMGQDNESKQCNEIQHWSDIHILGSASMTRIPAGPIMFSAMVNSRLITMNVLK